MTGLESKISTVRWPESPPSDPQKSWPTNSVDGRHVHKRWSHCSLVGKVAHRTARCFCSCYELRSSQALKCMAFKLAFLPTNGTLLILAKQKMDQGRVLEGIEKCGWSLCCTPFLGIFWLFCISQFPKHSQIWEVQGKKSGLKGHVHTFRIEEIRSNPKCCGERLHVSWRLDLS